MENKMVRLKASVYNRILALQEPRETLSDVIERCIKALELLRVAADSTRTK